MRAKKNKAFFMENDCDLGRGRRAVERIEEERRENLKVKI